MPPNIKENKKILLVNKFYYPRGGDCIYTIELEKLLKKKGHDVAVFAMNHPDSLNTPYRSYFPTEVSFSAKNKKEVIKSFLRPFGTKEVKKKFDRLLTDFQPDIVHLGNIHSQLSPVVAKAAHKKGIRVIWTLHDYKLLCPRYDCLRNGKIICEACFRNKFSVLRYSCMKNSRFVSVLAYLEALKWSKSKLEHYTDTFICPTEFVKTKMEEGGFRADKLVTIRHFINLEQIPSKIENSKSNYYCYVGRLSPEKGIETLLQVASSLPYKLKIIGSGPLADELIAKYKAKHIEFLGYKNWGGIKEILKKARFLVSPSECYEVLGLNNMEALCLGVPVLGANIGGIPELILEHNGVLFNPFDSTDLKKKINFLFTDRKTFDYNQIAETAGTDFSEEKYYEKLIDIYEQ